MSSCKLLGGELCFHLGGRIGERREVNGREVREVEEGMWREGEEGRGGGKLERWKKECGGRERRGGEEGS